MTRSYPVSVEDIAHELQGSCYSLEYVLERNEMIEAEDDIEFLRNLDDKVFNCDICSWWYELSELSDTDGNTLRCIECDEENN